MDPKDLRFTPTHEWAHLQGEVATVGISKFAVDQLTDLTAIDLPPIGTHLAAGQQFGAVDSVKSVGDLYAPVAGEVLEVNEDVVKNVQLLGDDPFGKGWLIKIRVEDPSAIVKLMDLEAYEKQVAEEDH